MDSSVQPRFTRRRWFAIAIVASLAIAAAGVTIALVSATVSAPTASSTDAPVDTGDEDGASEDPLNSVATPSPSPLSEDEAAEAERASASVASVISALDEISQRGDGSAVGVEAVATGWVLGELQSRAREQFDLEYKQTGEAVITHLEATEVDLASDPASITFTVCIDVSAIDVVDAAGNSLKDALYDPGHPVAHIYGAVFEDNTWKVSTHDIPDVQDCPKS